MRKRRLLGAKLEKKMFLTCNVGVNGKDLGSLWSLSWKSRWIRSVSSSRIVSSCCPSSSSLQRDNSDIGNAKNRKKWLNSDKKYAAGGYKKEQSVSVFGYGAGLDWTGKKTPKGPAESIPAAAPKFGRNYRAPNINTMKGVGKTNAKNAPAETPKKKGFFGMF